MIPSKSDISDNSVLTVKSTARRRAPVVPELERKRVVPALETFYAANPIHEQNMNDLRTALRKYVNLPYKKTGSVRENKNSALSNYRWVNINEYRLIGGGTRLKPVQYSHLVEILDRLEAIDKQLVNQEIVDILNKYRKPLADASHTALYKSLDQFGRAIAVGSRKTSSAKVYLVKGEGKIIVNGESLNNFFPRLSDRSKIMYPLKVVDGEGKYNVFVKCSGGGLSGKVGAIALGISKALVIFNPLLKPRLRKAGCVTRDSRSVERKKPGKVKSRKSPTWVKR